LRGLYHELFPLAGWAISAAYAGCDA
jgi:hypothetical protein